MCGRLAPARTERKTISLICWLLNQNASLAPLFVKKAFYGAADVNSITNPDVTCHIDLKGLHETRGIYKYKLGVIGLIDSGRHSIPSQRFLSLIFEDFYKLGIHESHHVASRWQRSEIQVEWSKQPHPESPWTGLWTLAAWPHLVHAVEEFPIIRGHLVRQVLRAHQLKSSHCPSGGAFLFRQGSLGIIVGNWIRITKGLSAECQTPSGVFKGKDLGNTARHILKCWFGG